MSAVRLEIQISKGKGIVILLSFLFLATSFLPLVPLSGGSSSGDSGTRSLSGVPMGDWGLMPSGGWPSSISTDDCDVMYREASKELVVFNGYNPGFEVWSFFGGNETWVKWNTSGTPPNPVLLDRAFTSSTNNSVAFFYGGWRNSGGYGNKLNVFFFSNKTWVEIDTPSSLGARYWSGMVYDNATDSVWIFGGRDQSGSRRDDLHQFNFTSGWTSYSPSVKPPTRDQPLMTITPDGRTLFVALGRYSSQSGGRYRNDAWSFDVESGSWNQISSDLGVYTQAGALFQYRKQVGDLIISMGYHYNTVLNNTYLVNITDGSVTREYIDGGLSSRHIHAWDLTVDGRTAVIFGDNDGKRDFWSLDLINFTARLMPGNAPWEGGSAFTGYDPEDGGKLMTLKHVSDSYWQLVYYALSDKEWHPMHVSDQNTPTYHDGMANAYDPVNNTFYLYGGVQWYQENNHWYANHYDDFWKLDCRNGEWTRINEHALPGPRGRAGMVVDADRRDIYLFGGQIPGGDTNSIAMYNITGNIWQTFNLNIRPQPRREQSMVFHPQKKGFYIFGGRRNGSGSNPELNDLWFFHADTRLWEKLPTEGDEPSLQNWAGLSVNTDTDELMLFGDGDQETFLWRAEWQGWKKVQTEHSPGSWSGHGQAYSTATGSHFAWAHDGLEVWEFNPILRTTAIQIQLYDPEGRTSGIGAVEGFPTVGTYSLKVRGTTDLPHSDLKGIQVIFDLGGDYLNVTWSRNPASISFIGNSSWVTFPGGEGVTFTDETHWEFDLPMEFTFNATHGSTVNARAIPLTDIGYPEEAKRLNMLRLNSQLEIVGYDFWTELQESPIIGGWLFGRTNISIRNLEVSFRDWPDVYPASGQFTITFDNQFGDSDSWIYTDGKTGNLSVPIKGDDRQWISFYLNLTSGDQKLLGSLEFSFRVDLDAPGIVEGAVLRADGFDDGVTGFDNDPDMFLTWDSVRENGSGLKGICYSLDTNLWPSEENITSKFKNIRIGVEGRHSLFVWAIDNTGRGGPVSEIPAVIDTHQIHFSDPNPAGRVNITYGRFVVSITVSDDLSGVNPDSIEYRYSLPSKQLSAWIPYGQNITNTSSARLTIILDLIAGMDNLVIFRANDLAGNGERESDVFVIHYDPGLKVPKVELEGPDSGEDVGDTVTLTWKGAYINPENITYELHLIKPDGSEYTFRVNESSLDISPDMPGTYSWYCISIADGKRNTSATRTFEYQPPFVEVSLPDSAEVTIGFDVPLEIHMKNTLKVEVTLTLNLEIPKGFTIDRGASYDLSSGEERGGFFVLNSSASQPGTYKIGINITDSYGRFRLDQVQVHVVREKNGNTQVNGNGGGSSIGLMIGISAAVLLLLAVIAVVLVMRRRKAKEAPETEDEEEIPINLDYDPTGVIAESSSGVKSNVPLAPGMLSVNEEELRRRGSNVVEITIPTRKKEDEMSEDLLRPQSISPGKDDLEEDEMEDLTVEEMTNELYGHREEE